MKKSIFILLAGILMVSCKSTNNGITKDDVQGIYDADFSSYLKQLLNDDDEMKDNPFAFLAELLVSDMKMTMTFNDDSLFTETKGSLIDFAQAFSDNEDEITKAYLYEIRNDSILFTKEDETEYEEFGVLRKTNNKYDSLILIITEDDGTKCQIPIVKRK